MEATTVRLGAAVWEAGWVAGEHLRAFTRNAHCEVVAVGSRTVEGARRKMVEVELVGHLSCTQAFRG